MTDTKRSGPFIPSGGTNLSRATIGVGIEIGIGIDLIPACLVIRFSCETGIKTDHSISRDEMAFFLFLL